MTVIPFEPRRRPSLSTEQLVTEATPTRFERSIPEIQRLADECTTDQLRASLSLATAVSSK
jgi:hypothetical protein